MNLGVVRNHVSAVGPVGTFPDIEMYWLPMQCQQCENPGCIEVVPHRRLLPRRGDWHRARERRGIRTGARVSLTAALMACAS